MDAISATALQVLAEHPHPAIRMSELLEPITERVDRTLDARRLLGYLKRRPKLFTVLDPLRGPWRGLAPREAYGGRVSDPWVLGPTGPISGRPEERSAAVLRDSVRWLAHGIDVDSPTEVSRCFSILLSAREARNAWGRAHEETGA